MSSNIDLGMFISQHLTFPLFRQISSLNPPHAPVQQSCSGKYESSSWTLSFGFIINIYFGNCLCNIHRWFMNVRFMCVNIKSFLSIFDFNHLRQRLVSLWNLVFPTIYRRSFWILVVHIILRCIGYFWFCNDMLFKFK